MKGYDGRDKQSLADLLEIRQGQTEALLKDTRNPERFIERAQTYLGLKYPDLAAADAYKALTLIEEALDQAETCSESTIDEAGSQPSRPSADLDPSETTLTRTASKYTALKLISTALLDIGCLRDSLRFLNQAQELGFAHEDPDILTLVHAFNGTDYSELSNSGFVRREVYPWNEHEKYRSHSKELSNLNECLHAVAPQLEVRSTTLPALDALVHNSVDSVHLDSAATTTQLGLFAKSDLEPGQIILTELSPLTATTNHDSSLCDCCQGPSPSITSSNPPISCESCGDVVFCSSRCHDLAQSSYHPSICGNEDGLEQIGRSGPLAERSDSLYLLLVARSIAMAEKQSIHPLDLPEIKYLWGEFSQPGDLPSLPFTFQHNIVLPFRVLEAMQSTTNGSTGPFTPFSLLRYDTWIINSLYAKFRGVASARQSTWDGAPEVSAVHPLWCLANHSCAPNVTWNWERQIEFKVRNTAECIQWGDWKTSPSNPGIRKGEEIFSHYCDIRLPVKERREWARGALGGICRCERCLWESGEAGSRADDRARKAPVK